MARQDTKTDRVLGMIAPKETTDGGGPIPVPAERRDIQAITADILTAKQDAGTAILRIGRALNEAKALLSHGEWLDWLEREVDFSERTAENLMRIAREYSNPQLVADLGVRKAVNLLALPAPEREAFIAASHTVDGEEKTVSEMTTRELEKAIRERDEARKELEVERGAVQEWRTRARDFELAKDEANTSAAIVEKDNAELRHRVRDLEAIEREYNELKSKPTEVAVETVIDTEAVEKARAEGLAEGRKEAAAVEDKLADAKKKQKAAENKLSNAEKELKETAKKRNEADVLLALEKEKTDKLRQELDAARAAKDGAATEDRALANLTAKQVGEGLNTLAQLMVKARDAGDGELEKLIREKFAAWLTGLDGMLKQ